MMGWLLSLLALAAQPAPARPLPEWPQTQAAERDRAVRSLYVYAVCVRHERRARAIAFLALPPGSQAERSEEPNVFPRTTDCAIDEFLRVRSYDLLRGAVAEAIYNFDRTRPRSADALPIETFERWRESEFMRGARMDGQREVNRWVARCATHRAPQLAQDLVAQIPGSLRERAALNALRPVFTLCLPQGRAVDASRLMIRTLVAEALYQASRAHPGAFRSGR